MTTHRLNPKFHDHLRTALIGHVHTSKVGEGRAVWRRRLVIGGTVSAFALAGGGAAVASGLVPLSFQTGQPYDVALGPDISTEEVGPIALSVTDSPQGANGIQIVVSCQDSGVLSLPGGEEIACAAGERDGTGVQVMDLPRPGEALMIGAPKDMRWEMQYTWLMRTQTEWRVNANGETFGSVKPDNSQPDLLAAVATNGAQGYIRVSQYEALQTSPTNPADAVKASGAPEEEVHIPVYASDGISVVGEYEFLVRRPS